MSPSVDYCARNGFIIDISKLILFIILFQEINDEANYKYIGYLFVDFYRDLQLIKKVYFSKTFSLLHFTLGSRNRW